MPTSYQAGALRISFSCADREISVLSGTRVLHPVVRHVIHWAILFLHLQYTFRKCFFSTSAQKYERAKVLPGSPFPVPSPTVLIEKRTVGTTEPISEVYNLISDKLACYNSCYIFYLLLINPTSPSFLQLTFEPLYGRHWNILICTVQHCTLHILSEWCDLCFGSLSSFVL